MLGDAAKIIDLSSRGQKDREADIARQHRPSVEQFLAARVDPCRDIDSHRQAWTARHVGVLACQALR